MSVNSSTPTRKYIRAQKLATMLAVHRTTLWRWVHDGHLPRPVQLGPNTVAWDSTEIDAWLAARAGLEEDGNTSRIARRAPQASQSSGTRNLERVKKETSESSTG